MVTIHGTRRVFEGRVITVRVDEVEYPNGHRGTVEVVEHRGGVAIIAQPEPRQIVLVRQFRPAIGQLLWEVPAGKLEPGEQPLQCATRELIEETGYRCREMRHLWTFYTAPGFCTELLHLYRAEELIAGEAQPEASEQIEMRAFDVDAAWEMVMKDELPDAKTQIALAWARALAR
ncbi:MAG TPA: NUDIX hydrolase [Candidatus Eremiobacteraceae bacterium]|nr:NUDIX hydrolase [Candidatus Eremiobacteraceae bacterium]